MPYNAGTRLPGERASRLAHLDVLKSELVNKLIKSYESNTLSANKNNRSSKANRCYISY
jgi:hypothetical protein